MKTTKPQEEWIKRRFPLFKAVLANGTRIALNELKDFHAQLLGGYSESWGHEIKDPAIDRFDKFDRIELSSKLRKIATHLTILANRMESYNDVVDTVHVTNLLREEEACWDT